MQKVEAKSQLLIADFKTYFFIDDSLIIRDVSKTFDSKSVTGLLLSIICIKSSVAWVWQVE